MPNLVWAIAWRARRRLRAEGGFTMIELMVAVGVILTALVVMALVATGAFSQIGLARQRQGADGLAQQTMEQMRALPTSLLLAGMRLSDVSSGSDPNITTNQCPSGATDYCFDGEQLVVGRQSVASGTTDPVYPSHIQTVTVGATTYTVKTYVTYYCPNASGSGTSPTGTAAAPCSNYVSTIQAVRVTVIVSWARSVVNGVSNQVQLQSVFYEPSGCVSRTTHPFAGPCQPFFYSQAALTGALIDVSDPTYGSSSPDALAGGSGFSDAALVYPTYSSTMQLEQVATVTGSATTAGVSATVNGTTTAYGQQTATSDADNDPTGTNPGSSQRAASNAAQQTGPGGICVTPSGLGGGSECLNVSYSSTSGTATSTSDVNDQAAAYQCVDPATGGPISPAIPNPCGNSNAPQVANLSAVLDLHALPTNYGAATVAEADAPSPAPTPANNVAFSEFLINPQPGAGGATRCQYTTTANGGTGCLHAEAYRDVGTVTIGGLPTGMPSTSMPSGWASSPAGGYLIRITGASGCAGGFTGTVSAEAGTGPDAPTATACGSVSYWNGSGYSTLSGSASIPAVSATATSSTGTLTVTISGSAAGQASISLSSGTRATTTQGLASGQTCNALSGGTCYRQAVATSTGPVAPTDIYYTVQFTPAGQTVPVTLATFKIHVTFGQLLAKTTYCPAAQGTQSGCSS